MNAGEGIRRQFVPRLEETETRPARAIPGTQENDDLMSMNSFHARQGRARLTTPLPLRPERPSGMTRADVLLVAQGLARSRSQAQALIKAGRVSWAGGNITKSALELPAGTLFTLAVAEENRYVSRGGLKLAGALAHCGLTAEGWTCLDVGQSTGGFTDCLLQSGAASVVGVDVGHGQLHPRLKNDIRVKSLEGINCRTLAAADLGNALPACGFELITADVSFISLTLVLPRLPALLATAGHMLLLVKPQFEVGPDGIGKGGIVRDSLLYATVEDKLRSCCEKLRLTVLDWFDSPIAGGDGNREFFIWIRHAS
jgi:23S rRNA (cytidine1920-2'-O)/16S rRNA (cytidine1409-2'-O)-methyltransferase